jgi:hypothetical protein
VAGDGFLVVWEEVGFASSVYVRAFDGVAARSELPIFVGSGHVPSPRAVWTGNEYLLLWSPRTRYLGGWSLPAVVGVRIRPDGTVVEGSQVTVGNWEHSGAVIAVAFDGTEVLAAVFHDNAYYLITLDRHGHFLSETLIDYEPGAIAARLGGGFKGSRAQVREKNMAMRSAAGR